MKNTVPDLIIAGALKKMHDRVDAAIHLVEPTWGLREVRFMRGVVIDEALTAIVNFRQDIKDQTLEPTQVDNEYEDEFFINVPISSWRGTDSEDIDDDQTEDEHAYAKAIEDDDRSDGMCNEENTNAKERLLGLLMGAKTIIETLTNPHRAANMTIAREFQKIMDEDPELQAAFARFKGKTQKSAFDFLVDKKAEDENQG